MRFVPIWRAIAGRPCLSLTLLHGRFGLEALQIAENRCHGAQSPLVPIAQQAIVAGDVTFDGEVIPHRRIADVVDRYVVVLAPEEGSGAEFLALAQHIERGELALPLGEDPMFDTDILAAARIGPARDIAGRKDS